MAYEQRSHVSGVEGALMYLNFTSELEDKLRELQHRLLRLEANPSIQVVQVDKDLPLPFYATAGSAGLDLYSVEDVSIPQNGVVKVSTGIKIAIPEGYEGQIRPRSSLGSKGLLIPNSPGTIDSDYRGEVIVALLAATAPVEIRRGDKIAQLVIAPVVQPSITVVDALDSTARGEGGFGSTGR